MILGLTGTMACGKGEVARYLEENKGFEHYIYSNIVKRIAKQRNIEPTRENLQKLGTYIKNETKNQGILSKKILEKIKTNKAVVDGIRNPDEIRELRKKREVYIIGIDAPRKIRYERIKKRKREGDPKTFEEFKRLDNLENRSKTKGQEINKCIKMADFIIINNGSIEKLQKETEKILQTISSQT